MRARLSILFILLALLAAAACNDNGTAPVDDFKFSIRVVDQQGAPVPDLDLYLLNDNDYLQKVPTKAAVSIQFAMPTQGTVTLNVLDIEGAHVRTLVAADTLQAGYHQVRWNGEDDEQVHMPSGRYTLHIVERNLGDEIIGEDSYDVLMSLTDRASVGTTDEDGRLVLTDRRLFPHLYDRPDMVAVDENGDAMGDLILDETMLFRFYSAVESRRVVWTRAVAGPGSMQFDWPTQLPGTEAPVIVPVTRLVVPGPVPDHPDLRAMPNPFN